MALKNLPSVVRTLGNKANPSCVSTPGKWNSCEPPSGSPIKIPGSGGSVDSCCDQLSTLNLGIVNDCMEKLATSSFTFPSPPLLDCDFEISFTFLPYIEDRTLLLELYVDGNPIIFSAGNPQTITLSPGSTIYAQATTGIFYVPNQIDITAYNVTCDIYYGNIGSINLWRSMECSIFPLWSIPTNISDNGTTLFSSTYQYTGGVNNILLEIETTAIIPNGDAEIYAYVGTDPFNPTNNNLYPIVVGGSIVNFPVVFPVSPGDYFTLFHEAIDGRCSNYQLDIYNRCPGSGCEQYFLIEEFIVNRGSC